MIRCNTTPHLLNKNSGFTLIEIMIAITLLSLLMMGVYLITDNSIETKDRVIAEDSEKLQIEAAFSRMQIDFSHIYSPLFHSTIKKKNSRRREKDETTYETSKKFPKVTKSGLPIPVIEKDRDEIIFLSSANKRKRANSKQSNYAWIKYKLRSSERESHDPKADNELIRYFVPDNPYTKEFDFEQFKPAVVLRNIKEIKFLLWNEKREKFVSSINELDQKLLVRSIKVLLTTIDSRGIENKHERIFRSINPYFDPETDEKEMKKRDEIEEDEDEND